MASVHNAARLQPSCATQKGKDELRSEEGHEARQIALFYRYEAAIEDSANDVDA